VKRYAGGSFKDAWWAQVSRAAEVSGKIPCVIYKFDRQPIKVAVDWRAIGAMTGVDLNDDGLIHMDLPSFCFMSREIMARRG